jgi:fatty-acyl-CoA synthase
VLEALDAEPERWDVSSLRTVLIGGAAAPPALIEALETRHGLEAVHSWGMTETAPVATMSRLTEAFDGARPGQRLAQRAKQGRPVGLIEIRAMADEREAPWDGETMGELEVRGPWVASGYHRGAGGEQFTADGWFRTGDIVSIDPHGYIDVRDRAKDLIKSGGEWISSVALESALMGHPDVAEAAVIAVPHERWGERPLAVVVPRKGRSPTAEALRAHLASLFPRWSLPDAYELVDEIPRTAAGKFKKSALRERFARAAHGERPG